MQHVPSNSAALNINEKINDRLLVCQVLTGLNSGVCCVVGLALELAYILQILVQHGVGF